jgi:quercetin dioxygenase-like cupin family protein
METIDMRNRFLFALTGALIAIVAISGIALATPSAGVTSTTIATGRLGEVDLKVKTGPWKVKLETKGQSDVTVVENRVAPGGSFGWHSHPGPSIIVVKSGTMTFYDGDDPSCAPEVVTTGQAVVDAGGTHVHVGRNEGTVDAVVIVTRLLPAGAAARVDQPDPGNCAF